MSTSAGPVATGGQTPPTSHESGSWNRKLSPPSSERLKTPGAPRLVAATSPAPAQPISAAAHPARQMHYVWTDAAPSRRAPLPGGAVVATGRFGKYASVPMFSAGG